MRIGFANVIDAFHVVGPGDIPTRFFDEARRSTAPSIVLTDALHRVAAAQSADVDAEVEARWNLVETAWELGVTRSIIGYEPDGELLVVGGRRRRSVTNAAPALNGHQKGRCFYCYRRIEVRTGSTAPAEVDHLFPHVLERLGIASNLDGVWNLVLACVPCNRGPQGKFDLAPDSSYVHRLHRRNEYLIGSHHPLRETLILQTERRRPIDVDSCCGCSMLPEAIGWFPGRLQR